MPINVEITIIDDRKLVSYDPKGMLSPRIVAGRAVLAAIVIVLLCGAGRGASRALNTSGSVSISDRRAI